MKRLALIAALSFVAVPVMAQPFYPTYSNGVYNRHNDPMQWTIEEMMEHQSHVTMPNGNHMTCSSEPDPIMHTTNVYCR